MRKVYQAFPANERVVEKELERMSRKMGVVTPKVEFWFNANAMYDPRDERGIIKMPSNLFCQTYDPEIVGDAARYWGLLMHEFAHHLDHIWNDNEGHTTEQYALLVGLLLSEGLPIRESEDYELRYKPGYWRRGMRMAGVAIIADFKAASFKETINGD